MGNSILYRMAAGIVGAISRAMAQATIETGIFNAAKAPTAYGVPVKIVAGKVEAIEANDAASVVYGFLVRPYPIQGATSEALGTATPPTTQPADIMRRGYMSVKLNAGTAAKAAQVYMRIANAAAGKPIGGIEAGADSGNCVAITGCTFTGPADADGITEIAFNI